MSDEPLLGTALIPPRAPGLRGLAEAVAFYARNPGARPRAGRLHRALWGVGLTLHAARLVVSDRALLRAALWPTGLTVLGCLLLAALATASDEDGLAAGARFQVFQVSFVALASMPPTVLQRLWVRFANQARRALGLPAGEEPFPDEPFLRMVWREGLKALRQAAVVSAGLLPLLVVLRLLPGGRTEGAAVALVWGFYWIVVDAFELPLEVLPGPRRGGPEPWFSRWHLLAAERSRWLRAARPAGRLLSRLSRPWHEEARFTERHPWETAGFGLTMGALLAVPVAGLFFRSVAIVAATALVGQLAGEEEAGGPPPLPPPDAAPPPA